MCFRMLCLSASLELLTMPHFLFNKGNINIVEELYFLGQVSVPVLKNNIIQEAQNMHKCFRKAIYFNIYPQGQSAAFFFYSCQLPLEQKFKLH